ncbi:DUF11 domain-containing protein, partial [Elusimicrobiota bacterium]
IFFIAFILIYFSFSFINAEITDNDDYLIIPEGETHTLYGLHSYNKYIDIRGTLNVTPYNASVNPYGMLELRASTVTINATGIINADYAGYRGSTNYNNPGEGLGGGFRLGGASYGGKGGTTDAGEVYGSIREPSEMGSGGGRGNGSNNRGGDGGGYIKLIVSNTLTVEGTVRADGELGQKGYSGSGSGGSIWIEANELTGSGRISVNGGENSMLYKWGPGGGGRIAVYYNDNNFSGEISAYGGNGRSKGGAGTIYLKDIDSNKEKVVIDNNGISGATTFVDAINSFQEIEISKRGYLYIENGTELEAENIEINEDGYLKNEGTVRVTDEMIIISSGTLKQYEGNFTVNNIDISNDGELYYYAGNIDYIGSELIVEDGGELYLQKPLELENLTIKSGGLITHEEKTGLELIVTNDLNIELGGLIDVSYLGYNGSNSYSKQGEGPGGSWHSSGASYGGKGEGAEPGEVYGSIKEPLELGSGGSVPSGAGSHDIGGDGGGQVKLVINNLLTVNGEINAEGADGKGGSGGSGGSIWIETSELSGNGVITVNGGNGRDTFKTGSGAGRIAIYYNENNFAGNITAYGGDGRYRGGAGTIYLKDVDSNIEELVIDNNGISGVTPFVDGNYNLQEIKVSKKGYLYVENDTELEAENIEINEDGYFRNEGITEVTNIITNSSGTLRHDGGNFTCNNLLVREYGECYLNVKTEIQNLTIENEGVVTHSQKKENFDLLVTGDLVIESGGKISVDYMGYDIGEGPGAGEKAGDYGTGAGFGGVGGDTHSGTGGDIYGSIVNPDYLGSGGGRGSNSTGSRGGGKLKIIVLGELNNNGEISTCGEDSFADKVGGGGSGGSIWIEAAKLSGNGEIKANGGTCPTNRGGGGAGGRIAIYYDDKTEYTGAISAFGGFGYKQGDAGTIFVETRDNFPIVTASLGQTRTTASTFRETIEVEDMDLSISSYDGPAVITGVDFEEFEKIELRTGSFKGKGFFKGKLLIDIGSDTHICYCRGVSYIKKGKTYLRGSLERSGYGVFDGVINEDNTYEVTINLTEVGNQVFTEELTIQGTGSSQQVTEYPSTKIYYSQNTVKGEISGYYESSINTIFTHLRIDEETSSYKDEGFAIISYNSDSGSGMGYGYGKKTTETKVEFQGLFTSPLDGFMRARLDESTKPNILTFSISRIDYQKPPEPDLKAKMWSPQRVSPGQTISYIIEVRNDGLVAASNYSIIGKLPEYSSFVSASEDYQLYVIDNYNDAEEYVPISVVRWDIEEIPPKSSVRFTAQTKLYWVVTLPRRGMTYIVPKAQADKVFPIFEK